MNLNKGERVHLLIPCSISKEGTDIKLGNIQNLQCYTLLFIKFIEKLLLSKCKIVENLLPKSLNSCTAEIVTMHSEIVDSHCSNSVH